MSIITASFNKANFISETINSVLSQTFPHFEYILVDDGSTDQSVEIIKKFQEKDTRIRLIENATNRGANYCRNKGIELAKGDYIVFLDADDLLSHNCLKTRFTEISSNTALHFCVFTMGVFKHQKGDMPKSNWIPNSSNPLKDFLQHKLPWSILQPIWRTSFLKKIGGFDESFMRLQDVELNTRALLQPGVNYKTICSAADCYYRVDELRKNYNPFVFLSRWTDSSVLFYKKFEPLTSLSLKPFLLGTIYETYVQILYQLKKGKISAPESEVLRDSLLNTIPAITFVKSGLLRFVKFYVLHLPRIPGVNKLCKTVFIH